jgi:acyl transferase domain-containing protein/NAD(P)H-dependent flavin oxidoreductase YrpB (nitropropane dioxygenase family)/NAD(P)-dependent dehydrogenase (short-subunit alcohol dehydrogenase family)/acyl carrier protein
LRSTLSILGITPFHRPDPGLAVALARAGARAAIDLGADVREGLEAVERAARDVSSGLGIRLHGSAELDPARVPAAVEFVILPPGVDPAPWRPRQVFVRVTSLEQALGAREAGADALIVAGGESPGLVGEETAFVLLQRVAEGTDLPLWIQGGIGPATAAACLVAGSQGIVLDDQLALAAEASTPAEIRALLAAVDGSETEVIAGYRVFARSDLAPVASSRGAHPAVVASRLGPGPLAERLLPLGQAAAFARPLAQRHRTVRGILEAVRLAAEDGVRAAREQAPLAELAPLARDHGIRYPIFQGPMTRVSDQASFARSVADAGALPFLALSLLGGEPLRQLLEETAERLGARPWGVGILGFVPAEKRSEQLKAIEAARPQCALVAGGRPSQARHLEELGISTYLHVPSRGLLDLFLRQGARRFVFEGRECGGHVGPLSSFALWQSQIDRLLEHDGPEELSIVFAGGIHDARSAAMVAALAGPLAARGARIGILMGTAYLFTREAVETGAIVEGYQEGAIACGATVLLETAPGHATRCVDSPYVRAFLEEKARLEASGAGRREIWAALEQLNLGRLRIASKGLVREGAELQAVPLEIQLREGMYMIGQVATLKSDVCTIEQLHREVSEGAAQRLEAAVPGVEIAPVPELDGPPRGEGADIAIVGMACIFPGAPDLESYWSNLALGVDSIREVPHERWNPERYYDPEGVPGLTTPSKWGGFLGETVFDPAEYGIPPRSLASIDPIQLLSLQVARRALEDAGYADRPFDRERTAVVFGAEGGTDLSKAYGFRALWPQFVGDLPEPLERVLPVPTEDTFPGVLTNVISGRIANRLDLGGENYTVNAACASSLAALSIAVQWLRAGECDMVLVGGADVHNSIGDFLLFSSVHALSPGGRCRTFDHRADGIALGEGVGVVVLKRRADAARDGDRVYAVIHGIGGSSDGRSLGLTAPRREGQVRALQRAYAMSGVSPSAVTMMEAHGTGTVVGDRTELQTLESTFGAAGAAPGRCALGSVKSQIGHTKGAAGVASLIKVALALHRRVLPPTLHIERPNAHYDPKSSPFAFDDEARPWMDERRVAGVSAFGFGGTNYHAVVSASNEHATGSTTLHAWPAELFLFRGPDRAAGRDRAQRLRDLMDGAETAWTLRELARATSCGGDGPAWLAVVARDLVDLRERIDRALEGSDPEDPDVFVSVRETDAPAGRLALLFPGQGSQYVGMLRQLFVAFPWLFDLLERASDVARTMHPRRAFTPRDRAAQDAHLTATETAQTAMGLCDMAMLRIVRRLGIEPDMVAGHSYGELVALRAAGVCSDDDVVFLSRARARAIQEAAGEDPGAMAAVMAGAGEITPLIEGLDVEFANLNAPRQTILSGPTAAIEAAVERLESSGVKARRLRVACAFHSKVVAGGRGPYRKALDAVEIAPPTLRVWCNATAAAYPADPDAIREIMADQLACSVRFMEQIEAMYAEGARVFLEAGPGGVLSGLVDRILGDRPHVAIPMDHNGTPGLVQLQRALARLAMAGIDVDLAPLYEDRMAEPFDLAAPPERMPAPTAWIVDGHYARPAHGELPPGAYRPVLGPVIDAAALTAPAAVPAPVGDAREAAVLEYLRNVSQLLEAQKSVLLAYLGAPATATAPASLPAVPAPTVLPAASAPTVAPAPAAVVPGPAAPVPLAEALLAIVAERTGYPVEMLDPDLDLEADLSIDSIKRIEILGTLSERIGLDELLGDARDEALEELATIKTLRGIVQWLESRTGNGKPPAAETAADELPGAAEPVNGGDPAAGEEPAPVSRFRVEVRSTPAPAMDGGIEGRAFAVTRDGRGVADALVSLLAARGARARVIEDGEALGEVDGLVHLSPLDAPRSDTVLRLYDRVREALQGPAGSIVGVTGMGGGFGHDRRGTNGDVAGGVGGFLKSLAKEWPEGRVRAIDVDPDADPARVAEWILEEMTAVDERLEVGRAHGERRIWDLVPYEPAAADEAPLDRESVVLVTGGARGIGSLVAIALARRFGCWLELVGRTPAPAGDEPAPVAGVEDPVEMKRRLVEAGVGGPAEIERTVRAILAARDVAHTLTEIRAAGGSAAYHAVDVRDEAGFGPLLRAVHARHGRLDGAIHAAGCIEDRPLVRKSRESFLRVFDTKVRGALTLLNERPEGLRFVVFFSSMASLFGNPGQTDYASANEVLDKLALAWNGRGGTRVLSVNWGPWDGTGMVDETLRRSFERRGVGLIPPERAIEILLDEIVRGDPDLAQIAVAAGPVRRER